MTVPILAALVVVLGYLLAEAGVRLLKAGQKVETLVADVRDPIRRDPRFIDVKWEDR